MELGTAEQLRTANLRCNADLLFTFQTEINAASSSSAGTVTHDELC